MSLVVQAMLKRVEIDLAEDEIGLAFQGFHLECWQATNHHASLKAHLKRLCAILGVPNAGSLLAAAAKKIAQVFAVAKGRGFGVDNRKAWTWALHPSWRVKYAPNMALHADCELVVQFYLSLKINTTTLERDLGELLAQLHAKSFGCGILGEDSGHAEAAGERLAGRNPYVPTAPVLTGLRAPEQRLPTKICVMVGNHRPVKLLPIYQRYNTTSDALSLAVAALGKVLASKKDMEAFMQSATPQAEAHMLHFSPAVHGRSSGIQLRDAIAQNPCIQFSF
eukprot:s4114_g3.t1